MRCFSVFSDADANEEGKTAFKLVPLPKPVLAIPDKSFLRTIIVNQSNGRRAEKAFRIFKFDL